MRWLICLAVILVGCGTVRAPRNSGALKGIATIHAAEVEYHYTYGRFATSLQELGPPATGADSASAAGMIERNLADGKNNGYRFTLIGTPAGYAISAVPEQYGGAGSRTYFSDQGMRIHVHHGPEPATANDPLQGEPPPQQSDPVAPRRDKTNS